MNFVEMAGTIIRASKGVRNTTNSRVTDVFMKCPNDDNAGFAFISVNAWAELADDLDEMPENTELQFRGKVNTRMYEENGVKKNAIEFTIQEIVSVTIPEKPKPANRNTNTRPSNNGRSPRQTAKR